jgi:hypothetical protein
MAGGPYDGEDLYFKSTGRNTDAPNKSLADYPKKTGKYCSACGAELVRRRGGLMCVRRNCRKYRRKV